MMDQQQKMPYGANELMRGERSAISIGTAGANATQIGGSHYRKKNIQPWDFISANDLNFLEGSVVKYVSRWRDKGGIEDLRKARHYLDKLIEVEMERKT